MILHLFCVLVMMMVSSVICAPVDDSETAQTARKDNQGHSSSGTLDSLGGGHLLRAINPESEAHNFMTLDLYVSYQDDIPQDMLLLARTDKPNQRPSSSGTLDSIGGGNILRVVDPETEPETFRSLVSLLSNQENMLLLARADKPNQQHAPIVDPLGGGNLVRVVDPATETGIFRSPESLANSQNDISQNMVQSRADKSKERPKSSGTLDPLGGGNLLKVVDSDAETENFRSSVSQANNEGRQNMMRLAREDKSTARSSHALDSLGGGRLTGLIDPYRGGQLFRSLDRSHLTDSLEGGEVMRVLDSITGSELLSSLDSAEGMAVLSALKKTHTKHPKRMLDSVSGWAFGESKRNFDEIDNVGFTGFAKKSPSPYYAKQLALAKKNFDEIDRTGFETYNKRDFDEIDRTGFETFEKRDRKE